MFANFIVFNIDALKSAIADRAVVVSVESMHNRPLYYLISRSEVNMIMSNQKRVVKIVRGQKCLHQRERELLDSICRQCKNR